MYDLSWKHRLLGALLLLGSATSVSAATLRYEFTTTVASVSASAPAPFAAIVPGTAISARIEFDFAASDAIANPEPGPLGNATFYPLAEATAVFNIGALTLDEWAGTSVALVFDNENTGVSPNSDGLLVFNRALAGNLRFKFGNLLLPLSTFASDALPGSDIAGFMILDIGPNNSGAPWLTSAPFTLLDVYRPQPSTVPLPGGVWLLGGALLGLVAKRRAAPASACLSPCGLDYTARFTPEKHAHVRALDYPASIT